jgi:hypothetical protein
MRYLVSAFFLGLAVWFFTLLPADARGPKKPYVPEIIEVEQEHAWCYVLKNDQSGAVGDINMLFCVPKGDEERNCGLLSLEEPDSD